MVLVQDSHRSPFASLLSEQQQQARSAPRLPLRASSLLTVDLSRPISQTMLETPSWRARLTCFT